MKVSICFAFRKSPWGGGNQFLKALKKEFEKQGVYEDDLKRADVVLFNSYPFGSECLFDQILNLKNKYPEKVITYRLNGPVSFVRGRDRQIDKVICLCNHLFVDGIVFQSNWCRKQNKKHFNICSRYETVIHNAPDDEIFNRNNKKPLNYEQKIKLIANSWSTNPRKGFDIYKYVDINLDFSKYDMTFIGNSPVEFENTKWTKSVPSERLAQVLKEHDIYITASQKDPCSNSLIEALCCGLPAVALNDGGHPELVQEGGELFSGKEDIIEKIEKVSKNYQYYQSQIPKFSIEDVTQQYYEFAKKIYQDVQTNKYRPKQINCMTSINFYRMKLMIFNWKILNKLKIVKENLWKN